MSKLNLMGRNHSDELYTPKEAIDILIPYLKKEWLIWECAIGTGKLAGYLKEAGFLVIGDSSNFLEQQGAEEVDCIITNPPFSLKIKFIEHCYEIGKPFALLLPLTALEGIKIQKMFRDN